MCHRCGRDRDRVLGVKTKGNLEARRDSSTSTRLVPRLGEGLGASGVVCLVGVVFFAGLVSFFFFVCSWGTVVVPRVVSSPARNLSGATRSRADLRTVGFGDDRGFGGGVCAAAPLPSPSEGSGRAASADWIPVLMRLATSARVLSSRTGCAPLSSPDISGGVARTGPVGQTAAQLHG
jgi:hypothetical protein